jgi:hypothetical protein
VCDWHTAAQHDIGLSINGTTLTTAIGSIADSEKLIIMSEINPSSGNGCTGPVVWSGPLNANDIVREQDDGTLNNTNSNARIIVHRVR